MTRRLPRWAWAALASMALHVAVAWSVWRPMHSGATAGSGATRGAKRAASNGVVVRVQVRSPRLPEPPPTPPPSTTGLVRSTTEAKVVDAGSALHQAETSSAGSSSTGPVAPEPSEPGGGGWPGAREMGNAPATPPEGVNDGFDYATPPTTNEVSEEILTAVHEHISRAAVRCYPPAAKRFRVEGEVTVSFCIADDGAPDAVEVDDDADARFVEAVRTCVMAQATPLPLSAAGLCFRLPVRFGGQ